MSDTEDTVWTIPLVGGRAYLRMPTVLTQQNFDLIKAWLDIAEPALVLKRNAPPDGGAIGPGDAISGEVDDDIVAATQPDAGREESE